MSGIVKKSFNNPDELRSPDKANVHVCDLGGVAAAKMVLQPGHDGWVEGDTECVALEFNATAAKTYAAKN